MIQRTAPIKFEMKSDTNIILYVSIYLRAGILNVDVPIKLLFTGQACIVSIIRAAITMMSHSRRHYFFITKGEILFIACPAFERRQFFSYSFMLSLRVIYSECCYLEPLSLLRLFTA